MFNIGDKVVYPMHGAGTIEAIEQKNMMGNSENYYVIKMPIGGIKLMVPTSRAKEIGVREIVDKEESTMVFEVLARPKDPYVHDTNWSKRYNSNIDKIKSGNINEVAEVVRDLSHRHMERGLSIGEKKMLTSAKNILISELVLTHEENHEKLDETIEGYLKISYENVSKANQENL